MLVDQEQLTLILGALIQDGDVGMRQRGRDARIFDQPGALIRIGRDAGNDHLDGHRAAMMGVAGPENLAHVAGAEPIEDFVLPKRLEHRIATIILTR